MGTHGELGTVHVEKGWVDLGKDSRAGPGSQEKGWAEWSLVWGEARSR